MTQLTDLAREISNSGIRHIFGIPGSGSSLSLIDALGKEGVTFHLTHFEGTAAMMAGAMGKISGIPGLALAIKGPGLANMIPGLAACHLETYPMVAITEAYGPDVAPSKAHKRLNHTGLVSGVVKTTDYIREGGDSYGAAQRMAMREIPGPVHLDLTLPFQPTGQAPDQRIVSDASIEPFADMGQLERMVAAAEKPVLILGAWAGRADLSAWLNQLNIPVFTTAAAKGCIDETLPSAAGVYTGVGRALAPEKSLLAQADLVIGLGLRHNEVLSAGPFASPAINLDPAGSGTCHGFGFKFIFRATQDERAALGQLLLARNWGLEEVRRALRKMENALLTERFMPADVFRLVADHFGGQARLALDTGHFCTIGEHFWRVRHVKDYIAAGQGRFMGTGLPFAIGAAVADATLPTILFAGDGGIGMFVSEAKLAKQLNLPIIFTLLSDAHLGSIRTRALSDHLTQKPVTIAAPEWIGIFEGMGIPGRQIKTLGDLKTALQNWSRPSGPLYLECAFDPAAYQEMVQDLRL